MGIDLKTGSGLEERIPFLVQNQKIEQEKD